MKNDTTLYKDTDYIRYIRLFDIEQLNTTVRGHIENYYNASNDSLDDFQYVVNKSSGLYNDIVVNYYYTDLLRDPELPASDVITKDYLSIFGLTPEDFRVFILKFF